MADERPRYEYTVKRIERLLESAGQQLGTGEPGCVASAAVSIGVAQEVVRQFGNTLWEDFRREQDAMSVASPHTHDDKRSA